MQTHVEHTAHPNTDTPPNRTLKHIQQGPGSWADSSWHSMCLRTPLELGRVEERQSSASGGNVSVYSPRIGESGEEAVFSWWWFYPLYTPEGSAFWTIHGCSRTLWSGSRCAEFLTSICVQQLMRFWIWTAIFFTRQGKNWRLLTWEIKSFAAGETNGSSGNFKSTFTILYPSKNDRFRNSSCSLSFTNTRVDIHYAIHIY